MTSRSPVPAAEVLDSLTDELATAPWGRTASLVAMVGLVVLGLFKRTRPGSRVAEVLYVANVPTGRLGHLASRSISAIGARVGEVTVLADRRLADDDFPQSTDFPSLGIRSLLRHVDRGTLRPVAQGVRQAWSTSSPLIPSRLAATYLFAAQHVRYELAGRILGEGDTCLLVTDFDRDSYAAPLVHVARARGWVTATTVHGSLNPETYCPFRAEHVLVWGEAQARAVFRHGGTAHVVGRADLVPREPDTTRVDRVVICDSGEDLSPQEVRSLRRLCEDARDRASEVQVRRHPRSGLLGGRCGWRDIAAVADSKVATRPLLEDLQPGDLVVGITSTSLVEALFAGYRVACVADDHRQLPVDIQEIASAGTVLSHADAVAGVRSRIVAAWGEDADRLLVEVIEGLRDK